MERRLSDSEIRGLNRNTVPRKPKEDRRRAFFSFIPEEMDRRKGKDRRKNTELPFAL